MRASVCVRCNIKCCDYRRPKAEGRNPPMPLIKPEFGGGYTLHHTELVAHPAKVDIRPTRWGTKTLSLSLSVSQGELRHG